MIFIKYPLSVFPCWPCVLPVSPQRPASCPSCGGQHGGRLSLHQQLQHLHVSDAIRRIQEVRHRPRERTRTHTVLYPSEDSLRGNEWRLVSICVMWGWMRPFMPFESIIAHRWNFRADSRLAPSQWDTSLQSNAVFRWLGTNLESVLNLWCLCVAVLVLLGCRGSGGMNILCEMGSTIGFLSSLRMNDYFNSLSHRRSCCDYFHSMWFLNTFYRLISWAFPVKLPLGECHRTLLMISQHSILFGSVPSDNKPAPAPMWTKFCDTVWNQQRLMS